MAYPTDHFELETAEIANTTNIAVALNTIRKNDMFAVMVRAYGGDKQERYYAPRTAAGPWVTRFYYNLTGFSHTYASADSDLEFDRVIMTSGNVRLGWNFAWAHTGAPQSAVILQRSFWYISPFPAAGFEYLGRVSYNHVGSYVATATWDTTADTHPAPT